LLGPYFGRVVAGAPDLARQLDRFARTLVIGILKEAPVGNREPESDAEKLQTVENVTDYIKGKAGNS